MKLEMILAKLDLIEKQNETLLKQNLISQKEILTAEEVAAYTGLKVRYIHNLVSLQAIPHYKPRGKMLYFKKEEINNWLLKGRVDIKEE